MGRPRKGTDPLTQRLQVLVTDAELAEIDDWMFTHRVLGRSEAIRQLIARGLTVPDGLTPAASEPAPKKKGHKGG